MCSQNERTVLRQTEGTSPSYRWADSQIYAGLYTGKERFQKSGTGLADEEETGEEKQRLDNFASWLVDGDEGD
jgi:hypothetical protein